jgi:hypothetical protein
MRPYTEFVVWKAWIKRYFWLSVLAYGLNCKKSAASLTRIVPVRSFKESEHKPFLDAV